MMYVDVCIYERMNVCVYECVCVCVGNVSSVGVGLMARPVAVDMMQSVAELRVVFLSLLR